MLHLNQWQPIDTAPKDGTYILLWDKQRDVVVGGIWHTEPETNNPVQGYEPGWSWWVADEDLVIWDGDAPDYWSPMPLLPEDLATTILEETLKDVRS